MQSLSFSCSIDQHPQRCSSIRNHVRPATPFPLPPRATFNRSTRAHQGIPNVVAFSGRHLSTFVLSMSSCSAQSQWCGLSNKAVPIGGDIQRLERLLRSQIHDVRYATLRHRPHRRCLCRVWAHLCGACLLAAARRRGTFDDGYFPQSKPVNASDIAITYFDRFEKHVRDAAV